MKKILLASLSVCILAGCSASDTLSSRNLAGEWVCMTNYDDLNIQTLDSFVYKKDGTISSQGVILTPILKPIFAFTVATNGTWKLENDKLIFDIPHETVKRAHHTQVTEIMQKDKKLKQYEENLYRLFSSQKDYSGFTVKDFKYDRMIVEQQLPSSQKSYITACLRKQHDSTN